MEPRFRGCDHPACERPAEYRAPMSRAELYRYYWFCLDHVRAYNAAWNYFAGMNQAEIERYQRDDAFWHRPTWRLGARVDGDWLKNGLGDAFGLFDEGGGSDAVNGKSGQVPREAKPGERQALAQMNLEWPVTLKEIKDRYKELVKRYHPDTNGADKEAEERLKKIIQAYTYLLSCGYS